TGTYRSECRTKLCGRCPIRRLRRTSHLCEFFRTQYERLWRVPVSSCRIRVHRCNSRLPKHTRDKDFYPQLRCRHVLFCSLLATPLHCGCRGWNCLRLRRLRNCRAVTVIEGQRATCARPARTRRRSDMIAISGPGSAPRRWIDVLGKWLGRLGLGCYTRPKIVLTLWAVLLALSAVAMMRLTVDPDVAGLLPSHYESVQDIEKVRERVGGVGYVVVLLKGGKREARRSLAAEVQQEIEQLDSVSYVESKRPEVFIRDKALWLMDIDDLRTLESRVHDRYEYAINRYFLDLDDKPPPQVEIQDLVANFSARFLGDGKDKEISELPETSDLYEDAARQALF